MRSHHHLFVWRRANAQAIAVHRFCDVAWRPQHGAAIEQLRRSSLSVALNIVEGHTFGPGKRCRFHARVAYGSAVESSAVLEFLQSLGIGTGKLLMQSREIEALVMRWLLSL